MARILHLTDLHVVREGTLASGVLDTRSILRSAIDRLKERLPALGSLDAVLVTGDISDDGSPDSYAFARAELDRLGTRLLVIPGNHDAREAMRAGFADLPEMPERGQIDWVATVGDSRLVGLDTLVEGQGSGRLLPESLSLLSRTLAEAGAMPIVVAMHHPPLRTGIRFMDAIGLENVAALDTAAAEAQAAILFVAGHVHGLHHGMLGRHRVATAPSVCSAFAFDIRSEAPVGFMLGPTGCAVIDTAEGGLFSAVPLDPAVGPFAF